MTFGKRLTLLRGENGYTRNCRKKLLKVEVPKSPKNQDFCHFILSGNFSTIPTRKKFAEKLNIPETTLRNYETDAREPGHTFLKQMSGLFNVSTEEKNFPPVRLEYSLG